MKIKKILFLIIIILMITGGLLMSKISQKNEIKNLNDYIIEGNIPKVEKQILRVRNINQTPYFFDLDRLNYPPLVLASYLGELEICKLLIENDADINNNKGTKSATPLIASLYGTNNTKYDIANFLIYSGADVTKKDFHGDSPLSLVFSDNIGSKNNYDINEENKQVELALLIISKGGNIFESGSRGNLLFYASECNNLKMVKYLVEEEMVDINIIVDKYNYTALMYAVCNGNYETVEYLIENGANPNLKNKYNETVYDMAIKKGNLDILNLLP